MAKNRILYIIILVLGILLTYIGIYGFKILGKIDNVEITKDDEELGIE